MKTESQIVERFLNDIAPLALPRIASLETLADEITRTSSCIVTERSLGTCPQIWNGKLQFSFESVGTVGRNEGKQNHLFQFNFADVIKETLESAETLDGKAELKLAKDLRRFAKMLNKAAEQLST